MEVPQYKYGLQETSQKLLQPKFRPISQSLQPSFKSSNKKHTLIQDIRPQESLVALGKTMISRKHRRTLRVARGFQKNGGFGRSAKGIEGRTKIDIFSVNSGLSPAQKTVTPTTN